MIKLLRVDDRLIHGQVAMVWTSFLQAKTIVVANTESAVDPILTMALSLAKPPGVALHILTIEDAIKFLNVEDNISKNTFVVVNKVKDAHELCMNVSEIKDIILGGVRNDGNKKLIDRQVYMDDNDFMLCKDVEDSGRSVHIQIVPSEKKITLADAKKIYDKK